MNNFDQNETQIDKDFILCHVGKLLQKLNLKMQNVIVESGAEHGENFAGIIAKIYLEATDLEGNLKVFNFISKNASKDLEYRKVFYFDVTFPLEILMYMEIFPAFGQILKENKISESFDLPPKCYYTCGDYMNEILIFENMKEQGFKVQRRQGIFDMNHIKLILKNYSKFHVLSFELRKQKPHLFQNLKEKNQNLYRKFGRGCIEKILGGLIDEVESCLDPIKDKITLEKFQKWTENRIEILFNVGIDEEYSVFTHGDSWIPNFLFKYEDELNLNIPTKVCFIDFQVSMINSPVADLGYFLYVNLNSDILEKSYDHLMEYYYDCFKQYSKQFNDVDDDLYPRHVFEKHLKEYSANALYPAYLIKKFMVTNIQDFPEFKNCNDLQNYSADIIASSEIKKDYYEWLRNLVLHCERYNYI